MSSDSERRHSVRLLSCTLVSTLMLFATPAVAYRTLADHPDFPHEQRVRWTEPVFEYVVHENVPAWLPIGSLTNAAERALGAWSAPVCADVHGVYTGLASEPASAGDGVNTVEIVTSGWEAFGYEREAVGATDLHFEQGDDGVWKIIEADIRLNAEHHEWSLSDTPVDGRRSLLGTLRHEAGHALGILHPCELGGTNGAPECDGDALAASIMYPLYEPGQVELLADDDAAICFLYPSCETKGCTEGFECTPQGCQQICGGGTCSSDEYCVDDVCLSAEECEQQGCFAVPPPGFFGCEATAECASSVCHQDGSCARACVRDADCDGTSCVFGENPDDTGYCAFPPRRALGDACEQASDCAEGECLEGARRKKICTRPCGPSKVSCPQNWSCTEVEERSVCVPPRAPRGCQATVGSSRIAGSLLMLGVLSALRRGRRHRRRHGRVEDRGSGS